MGDDYWIQLANQTGLGTTNRGQEYPDKKKIDLAKKKDKEIQDKLNRGIELTDEEIAWNTASETFHTNLNKEGEDRMDIIAGE